MNDNRDCGGNEQGRGRPRERLDLHDLYHNDKMEEPATAVPRIYSHVSSCFIFGATIRPDASWSQNEFLSVD